HSKLQDRALPWTKTLASASSRPLAQLDEARLLRAGESVQLRANVGEGDVLLVKIGGEVATDANSKNIVAAIAYYDETDNLLPTPYPKTATSERFPAYIYVATTDDAAAHPAFTELPVPA